MIFRLGLACALLPMIAAPLEAAAVPAAPVVREASEYILRKFGKGVGGRTVDEIAEATTKAVARHGDGALPFLRSSGHVGFEALKNAGEQAPDVIRLYARRGDEAIWVVSEPGKLAIFLKHGDSAADALLRHPGIADTLIGRFGDDAVGALNGISRQSAQRLGRAADEGLLTATNRSPELLAVVREYGDEAMDFIWRNKGALTVVSVLATFLKEPELYIRGVRELAIEPIVAPIVQGVNWSLVVPGALLLVFLPFITRSVMKARKAMRAGKQA